MEIYLRQKKKLFVFAFWPATLWLTELFFITINAKAMSIRSAHTIEERREAVSRFNDPNYDCQVLNTSTQTSATSVNLQHACSNVIFVDIPMNANQTLEAIGRVFRIGQLESSLIGILSVNYTYDQAIQCQAAVKMIGQIAGQGRIDIPPDELERVVGETPKGVDGEE